ncbi:MAG TPA: hypothetical protein VER58_20375 [Thermoanaerobaculia bacterium]|nr:hypothetical protein [Thermoanaerobaculia bacterium]
MKFRLSIALLIALFPVLASALTPGTAKGTITFNGKPKKLTYAYAWKEEDHFTKGVINTVVLLSDAKLDDKTMADRSSRTDAARAGKFTGVLVNIGPKGNIDSGTFYTAAEDGYFDASGMHKWEKKTLTNAKVEGKLSAPHGTFFKTSYEYSATFEAPIGPAPKK